MKYICETLFRLKELLEVALNLNDIKLRKLLENVLKDLNKATEPVDCIENKVKLEKKEVNYII